MKRDTEKIIGYSLLAAGLILITSAIIMTANVFTGKSLPPQISKIEYINLSTPVNITGNAKTSNIQFRIDRQINKIFDTVIWYLFMIFVVLSGSKIAGLGIQFLREIKINVSN